MLWDRAALQNQVICPLPVKEERNFLAPKEVASLPFESTVRLRRTVVKTRDSGPRTLVCYRGSTF